MAVSYPITLPTSPGIRSSRFGLRSNTLMYESPVSRVQQVSERGGAQWWLEYEWPPMLRAQAAALIAALVSLRGRRGFFKGYDPDARTPRGVATGTPLVNGGSQTGNSLATDGWTPSTAGILKAGDYFSVAAPDQRLYQVVEDASSNGSGQATLVIEPALRVSPTNNATITVTNPFGHFRLLTDEVGWDANHVRVFGLRIAALEVL